jgi:hypothetical protein
MGSEISGLKLPNLTNRAYVREKEQPSYLALRLKAPTLPAT